jgi:iron(III) transport system substrate-binding protein
LKSARRIATKLATAAVFMMVAAGVARAADAPDQAALYAKAKTEGKLVLYHGAPADPMRRVVDDFQKAYPGVPVSALRNVGPRVFQQFTEEESAGHHIADAVMLSDYPTMVEAVKEGLFAEWKIPTFERIPANAKIGDTAYSPYLNEIAIAYNVNKVTPDEVKLLASSWKSVADPRFKGRVAVSTNPCGNCYAGLNMFLDPKLPQFGPAFLKQVAANQPGIFGDNITAMDRVVAGQYDIGFYLFETAMIPQWQAGAPIRWVHPQPTPLWANSFIGVAAHAPHPAAARLFIDWLFSDAGAHALQNDMGAMTTLEGVPDDRAVVKQPWYDPIRTPYHVDMKRWASDYDSSFALWTKILKAGRN